MNFDISFLYDDLKDINSPREIAWIDGKYYGSLISYIAHLIKKHIEGDDIREAVITAEEDEVSIQGETCPKCLAPAYVKTNGCDLCMQCGYSHCD